MADDCAPKNNLLEAKPLMSLIPLDILRDFLTPAYMEGLQKYWRESWRKGFKTSDMFDAMQRHATQYFYELEDYDQETMDKFCIKKHHLGAILFCVLCMCDTAANHPELDDRKAVINGETGRHEG